jgi:hypothetical protein
MRFRHVLIALGALATQTLAQEDAPAESKVKLVDAAALEEDIDLDEEVTIKTEEEKK